MAAARVTVTLPEELLVQMDQQTENRSLFVAEAVRAELERRWKERLAKSLEKPHPESSEMVDWGFREWVYLAAEEDASLVDPDCFQPISWEPGLGWQEPT